MTSARSHLERGLRLAKAYNWVDAAPDFVEAERLFVAERDDKGAYYARLGRIRSTMERGGPLPEVIFRLQGDLDSIPFLKSDPQIRIFCLIVKGDFDGESDHSAMARDWEEVRSLAKQLGDQQWENRATAQLGIAAYYNGDLEGARQRVGLALMGAHRMGDKPGEMLMLAILANGLNFTRLYGQALPYAEQAISIAQANPEIGYPHVAHQSKLIALIGMGNLDAAQQLADEMLTFARERGGKPLESSMLTQLAQIARLRGDQERAITLLTESIRIATAGGYLDTLAEALNIVSGIYVDRKDLPKAEVYASQASESAQARGDFVALPARLATLGRIQIGQGKYADADRVFSRAGAFVDSMVGRSEGVLDKTALITASSDLYRQHFALIADHFHDPNRAYGIIEQVRGRVMADLLASGSFADRGAQEAARRAAAVRLKLMAARSNAEVNRISEQLFIMEQARWITPDVSILKARSRKRVSLEAVKRSLPASTVILEYIMADPRSYCLVITRTSTRIVRLPSSATIERDVVAYLTAIKAKQPAEEKARALFASLIHPIHEANDNANLVIVRDGQLHLLPFDALIDRTGRYVAESKVVSYSGSASNFYLLRLSARRESRIGALLGVGGIPYDMSKLRTATATRGYESNALTNLPESKNELIAAAKAVSNVENTLLLGLAATESAFKREPFGRYRILHMAVHALVNTAQPDRAALVMLSDAAAGEDGFLQASEVVHLKLNADLVVLSACDTAIGPIGGEEGIATLSRAFLLAGARTVVSTLWSIEDLSSLVLMRHFYGHLAEHLPADKALAEAKRDIIKKFSRKAPPYYWAAFTLEGAGDRTTL